MKRIISGKKYDTETAIMCGEFLSPSFVSDCVEHTVLYRKTNGEYFFHRYMEQGHGFIEPITEVEAKKWSEHFLSVDEYENIFGEVSE
ncbi:hypothetical protein [Oribacterium sp.]